MNKILSDETQDASLDPTVNQEPFYAKFKLDYKAFLQPLLQKNRRSHPISSLLILLHHLELFSLIIRSKDFLIPSGLMPTFHTIFAYFNLRYLFPEDSYNKALYGLFAMNMAIFLLVLFSMMKLVTTLPKKNFFKKELMTVNLFIFQVYNWVFLVPALHLSGFMLPKVDSNSFINILALFLTIVLGLCYEYLDLSTSFKIHDHLARNRNFSSRLLFNYKLFICTLTGLEYFNEILMFSYYLLAFFHFAKTPSFHSYAVSQLFFSCLSLSIFATVAYFFANQEIFFTASTVDLAYLLFFAATVITKLSLKYMDFLFTKKVEEILGSKDLVSLDDFQLYNREIYRHYRQACEGNIQSRVIFLTFFATHQNECQGKQQENSCACVKVTITCKQDLKKHKKIFMMLLNYRFQEYILMVNDEAFPMVFLNYCSFVLLVLKSPSKALNLLFTHKHNMRKLEDVIQMEILIKKSKKILEKKLLNNDQYAQSLASVIIFDKDVKHVEIRLRRIIENMMKLHELLLQDFDFHDKFLDFGNQILENLEKFKTKIMSLLDKNVKNARLLQLAAVAIKYLTEDIAFRNFYKQLNIKRINQALQRKNHDNIDIFGHDSGILFVSLGKSIGSIEKVSKNLLKIFGYTDINEILDKNVACLMPEAFQIQHDNYLKDFLTSGRGRFLTSGMQNLYAVKKDGSLVEIRLLIRLDTVFNEEFVVAGYVKVTKPLNNRVFVCDIYGNLMNATKDCQDFFPFIENSDKDMRKMRVNAAVFMPEIIEKLFPSDISLYNRKEMLDFKQKGFFFTTKAQLSQNNNSVNLERVLFQEPASPPYNSSSSLIQTYIGPSESFEANTVLYKEKIYHKILHVNPQDFSFHRAHYQCKTWTFTESGSLQVRVFEVFDIFELNEPKLFSLYLTKITEKLKDFLITKQPILDEISLSEQKSKTGDSTFAQRKGYAEKSTKNIDFTINLNNNAQLSLQETLKEEQKSASSPSNSLNQPENPGSANNEASKQSCTVSASFEIESELSLRMENEQQFEQKISEISNNQANRMTSEDSITNQDDRTQTYQASQVSKVSSHASGDAKKATISLLMKTGGGKVFFYESFGYVVCAAYFAITIALLMVVRTETFSLQRIIGNSGLFHDQLSPICVLLRDMQAYEWKENGILQQKDAGYLEEIRKSFDFTYILLQKAYEKGIEQMDSSMDYVYLTYLPLKLKNITIYTYILPNGSLQVLYKYTYPEENVHLISLDLPKALAFFLAASQHLHLGYALNLSQEVSDVENYHYFLKENVLELIRTMLKIFQINKNKIKDSVTFLNNINFALIFTVSFITAVLLVVTAYIIIKNRLKCQKFIGLFAFFPENEIQERFLKLSSLMERYFGSKRRDISINYLSSTDPTLSQTASSSKFKSLNKYLFSFEANFKDKSGKTEANLRRKRARFHRSNSINPLKNAHFQRFLMVFTVILVVFAALIVGIYLINYQETGVFMDNTVDIMNNIDSLETYSITISIRYALNSVLLGFYSESAELIKQKLPIFSQILNEVNVLQSTITDLSTMFRKTGTSNLLTDIKYEFFTTDICKVAEKLKNSDSFQEMQALLASEEFCDNLLKNVLTKGSTSFAFSANELFESWQILMEYENYSLETLLLIIQSQEYRDVNLALVYVYAIGKYYSNEMQKKTENYFDDTRNQAILWLCGCLAMLLAVFSTGFRGIVRYLREALRKTFCLIQIFPFVMISTNKVLENKIAKMFRLQRI